MEPALPEVALPERSKIEPEFPEEENPDCSLSDPLARPDFEVENDTSPLERNWLKPDPI